MLKFGMTSAMGAMALAALSGAAWADVKSGVDAYQRGDYAAAIREWRPLADRGDPDAQFNLAQAYKLGRGVPANLDTAISWYRKAAARDHGEAQALLGLILFQNGKRAEAMPWLSKAANRGDSASQYVYGTALFNGDMVKTDWPRAYALMTQAAAQGLAPATSALAEMDKHIPLAQRQQGAAMARSMPRPAPVVAAPVRTAQAPLRTPRTIARSQPRRVSAPTFSIPRARDDGPPARPVTAPVAVRSAARPAPARSATALPGGRWMIQLGAFGQPGKANSLFASLKSRVGALSGAQPYLVRAGAVTRLQAGPFASRAAAANACAQVAKTGNACFPVAP